MNDNYLNAYLRKEAAINGVTNCFFNGVIAWFLLKDKEPLSLLGGEGGSNGGIIAGDMVATALILVFIVALIMIPINRNKVKSGKLDAMKWDNAKPLHKLLKKLPSTLWQTALLLGVFAALVLAPLSVAILWLCGVDFIPGADYAMVKGVWAGGIAAIMVGPMILIALADDGHADTKQNSNQTQ